MPEIAKLGHVELVTPDLEGSTEFFRDVIGLREVERSARTVYLRGEREREHHSLALTEGDEPAVDHIGWRTAEPDDVDAFASRLERDGTDIHEVSDEEVGQGRAIRFRTPTEHVFELYYDMDTPDAPAGAGSRNRNQVYRSSVSSTAKRIDHVTIRAPDVGEASRWFERTLGFQVNERLKGDEGTLRGSWMSVTPKDHDLAVTRDDAGRAGTFSHVAFYFDSLQDLLSIAAHLYESDIPIDGGPGRHAIGQSNFLYVREPASTHRVECYNGGYLVLDPDWDPPEWSMDEFVRDGEYKGAEVFGHGPASEATYFR